MTETMDSLINIILAQPARGGDKVLSAGPEGILGHSEVSVWFQF